MLDDDDALEDGVLIEDDDVDYRVFSPDEEDSDPEDTVDIENKPPLDDVIARFARGEFVYSDLSGLSDLGSTELVQLASRWQGFSSQLRVTVVREAADIAVDAVFLELSRFFIMASHDEEPAVRQLAAQALGMPLGIGVAPRLMELLELEHDEDVRIAAAASLGAWMELAVLDDDPPGTAESISDLLFRVAETESESWHVRRRAAESVAIVGSSPRIGRLIQRMYDEDETGLRASALYAVGRAGQREWLSIVLNELVSDEPEIRYEAIRAAGALQDTVALPMLSELANDDEDTSVRQAAIVAIGEIGSPGAARSLHRLAEDAREGDRDVIADALIEATFDDEAF